MTHETSTDLREEKKTLYHHEIDMRYFNFFFLKKNPADLQWSNQSTMRVLFFSIYNENFHWFRDKLIEK
jgi:hypothetical protein